MGPPFPLGFKPPARRCKFPRVVTRCELQDQSVCEPPCCILWGHDAREGARRRPNVVGESGAARLRLRQAMTARHLPVLRCFWKVPPRSYARQESAPITPPLRSRSRKSACSRTRFFAGNIASFVAFGLLARILIELFMNHGMFFLASGKVDLLTRPPASGRIVQSLGGLWHSADSTRSRERQYRSFALGVVRRVLSWRSTFTGESASFALLLDKVIKSSHFSVKSTSR